MLSNCCFHAKWEPDGVFKKRPTWFLAFWRQLMIYVHGAEPPVAADCHIDASRLMKKTSWGCRPAPAELTSAAGEIHEGKKKKLVAPKSDKHTPCSFEVFARRCWLDPTEHPEVDGRLRLVVQIHNRGGAKQHTHLLRLRRANRIRMQSALKNFEYPAQPYTPCLERFVPH